MLFTSVEFFLFFCIVVPLYFLIPGRWRIPYLLLVSYIFYSYGNPPYILVLLFSTLADYFIARNIRRSDSPIRRKRLLMLSLVINLSVLFIFKYLAFSYNTLTALLDVLNVSYTQTQISLLLPLGISFYTFTKIAYVVDVYRKKIQPETSLVTFATFIAFFPNVISGPIERAGHLIPQLRQSVKFDDNRVVDGLRLIVWGAFKKLVIADRLALYINNVYGNLQEHTGAVLITATVFLAFQIYADFSGYTDIARGIARILGFDLFENFRQPYLSTSVLEFWRRWHMSLTSWIREYMFFPLSRYLLTRTGRRNPRAVEATAYLIIMSLIGLWHGASWTFVIWGLLHGTYMAVESIMNARRIQILPSNRLTHFVKIITTFVLVTFAWIFFRAASLGDAAYIITHLFNLGGDFLASFSVYTSSINNYGANFLISVALIILLILSDWVDAKWGLFTLLNARPVVVRWLVYYAAIGLIFAVLISVRAVQTFVYFQF